MFAYVRSRWRNYQVLRRQRRQDKRFEAEVAQAQGSNATSVLWKWAANRWMQVGGIILVSLVVMVAVLAAALAWGPHNCKPAFPMVIGCALGSYEGLAGGMVASIAALAAGWLAWSGVQSQIEAEAKRATADRVEVEEVLSRDIDSFADGLGSIWRLLDTIDPDKANFERAKIEGIIYGIEQIAKESWLSTSRRMVTVLGWERRRAYEQLFDGLEGLRQFRNVGDFVVFDALTAVRSVSRDFEFVQPETYEYFRGLWRRAPKAWDLGYAIARNAGLSDEEAAALWQVKK